MPVLGSIRCTPTEVAPGQSFRVEVLAPDGTPHDEQSHAGPSGPLITINGVTGPDQYLQFEHPGSYPVMVAAADGDSIESLTAEVTVLRPAAEEPPAEEPPTGGMALRRLSLRPDLGVPMMRIAKSAAEPYAVGLSVGRLHSFADGLTTGPAAEQPRVPAELMKAMSATVKMKTLRSGTFAELADEHRAVLTPAKPDTPKATSYEWDFGDGTTAKSTEGYLLHDFEPALGADNEHANFHVRVKVTQPGEEAVEVVRTVSVFSSYVTCKRLGTLVPKVRSSGFARRMFSGWEASLNVQNIEKFPLTLTERRIQAMGADGDNLDAPGPIEALPEPLVVPASGSAVLSVTVGPSQVSLTAPGFIAYYSGTTPDGMPVRVEAQFDVSRGDHSSGIKVGDIAVTHLPLFRDAINHRAQVDPPPEELPVSLQEKTVFDGARFSNFATAKNEKMVATMLEPGFAARSHVRAGASAARSAVETHLNAGTLARAATLTPQQKMFGTLDSTSVEATKMLALDVESMESSPFLHQVMDSHLIDISGFADAIAQIPSEGATCDPDNVPDDTGDWVCQATGKSETVIVKGKFRNARKGDIILSPGGSGLIGGLLRSVEPPQRYSHSGIMTRNYDEITHSTASEERVEAYPVGVVLDGEKRPTDGHRPDILKYAWPGVVKQSVEAAIFGEQMVDPETAGKPGEKSYKISSFSPYADGMELSGHFEVVAPMVVKPDPMVETPEIRKQLHKIADAAVASVGKSHYRFFCYTDPTIGQTSVAPPESGWAAGTFPSVCSSFLWLLLKKAGIPLESSAGTVASSDLEPMDKQAGAQIDGASTPDGLYFYTEQERRLAAEFLFNSMRIKVSTELTKESGGLIGELVEAGSDIADDVANQMVNAFASDWTDTEAKDSERWRDPGSSKAVSPDNILFWDAPALKGLYGYAAPAHYREPRIETVPMHAWKKVVKRGKLHGTVRFHGAPVAAAMVQLYDGMTDFTDADGRYELSNVPHGPYTVTTVKDDTVMLTAKTPYTLEAADAVLDIELAGPDDMFRQVLVDGTLHIVDFEDFGSDEIANPAFHRELYVGPFHTHEESMVVAKMGGEVRVEVRIVADWQLDKNVRLWWEMNFFEGDSEDTDDLDGHSDKGFDLGADRWQSWKSTINSGGAGSAEMNVVFANNVNPN